MTLSSSNQPTSFSVRGQQQCETSPVPPMVRYIECSTHYSAYMNIVHIREHILYITSILLYIIYNSTVLVCGVGVLTIIL